MKRAELYLEHRLESRLLRAIRIDSKRKSFIVGSHRNADLRLLGPEVSPFHAVIEFRDSAWFVFDFGSSSGTWVDKSSIVERKLNDRSEVIIGRHKLVLTPKWLGRDTFVDEGESSSKFEYHQIIVRYGNKVQDTLLLDKTESYQFLHDGKVVTLEAPKSHLWATHQYGKKTIQQRLVPSEQKLGTGPMKMEDEFKKPFYVVATTTVLLVALAWFMPKSPDSDMKLDKPDMNKYSEMIFDSSVVKKKREESKKIVQSSFRKTDVVAQGDTGQKAQATEKNEKKTKEDSASYSKVITKIRASGLSQLIGKIAKRSSKTGQFVFTQGVSADQGGTGRAIAGLTGAGMSALDKASVGRADNGNSNSQFKISGIGTAGKGGGSKSYQSGGGLGTGNIGQAEVGMVDDESIIEGGLDREIIAEVIRKDIGQIRYCYERQLSGNPDLYGKILVKFSIGANGMVETPKIGVTTLKSAMVEGCILRRVASWKFPQPKGGTTVLVSYPFLFKSTD